MYCIWRNLVKTYSYLEKFLQMSTNHLTSTRIHMWLCPLQYAYTWFTFLQPAYIRDSPSQLMYIYNCAHNNPRTCTKNSSSFPRASFLSPRPYFPDLQTFLCSNHQSPWHKCRITYAKSTMSPHTLHTMNCHNNLSPLHAILRGHHRITSKSQHQIRLYFGCEAPTQTHKYHHQKKNHQLHSKGNFQQNKSVVWWPRSFPHAQRTNS